MIKLVSWSARGCDPGGEGGRRGWEEGGGKSQEGGLQHRGHCSVQHRPCDNPDSQQSNKNTVPKRGKNDGRTSPSPSCRDVKDEHCTFGNPCMSAHVI